MKKPVETKILLTLDENLKKELQIEGKEQYRSLNNYILWLLIHRNNSQQK